jgi:HK97 gp10 family phage protein
MEISIKIVDINALAKAFKKAPEIALPLYARALERSARKIEADAKRNAPVNKQSGGGTLRQSISSRMQGNTSAIIESRAKYSAYVDQGTRPHIIRVRNAKVLANRRTGQFFGRVVKHPGTKSQPYFTNAVEGNEKFMNNELQDALQNILNAIR